MKRILEIKKLSRLHGLLVILFFISFIFDFRPLVGFATILMAVNAFVHHRLETGKWWNPYFFNLFVIGLFLFFTIQVLSLLYTRNIHNGLASIETNLGMLVLPVGVAYSSLVNPKTYGIWMRSYVYILFAATLLALSYAGYSYFNHRDLDVFFYHPLVVLYSKHAIQFSIIVFFAILFLIKEYCQPANIRNKTLIGFLLIYFSLFIFMLSSKLVILVYFVYVVYTMAFTNRFIKERIHRILVFAILTILVTLVFLTKSPISQRLREDAGAGISFIYQQKFNQGDYFTGLQFRVLSWRFVYEILNEKSRWLLGVSPGDSQEVLNEKYSKENLFMGGISGNEKGYGAYHTHNQFLQALLETGVPGLAFFIMTCLGLVHMARKSANSFLWIFTVLLLCFCFTDAPLKTQYGIVLFVFYPLFLYKGSQIRSVAGY